MRDTTCAPCERPDTAAAAPNYYLHRNGRRLSGVAAGVVAERLATHQRPTLCAQSIDRKTSGRTRMAQNTEAMIWWDYTPRFEWRAVSALSSQNVPASQDGQPQIAWNLLETKAPQDGTHLQRQPPQPQHTTRTIPTSIGILCLVSCLCVRQDFAGSTRKRYGSRQLVVHECRRKRRTAC